MIQIYQPNPGTEADAVSHPLPSVNLLKQLVIKARLSIGDRILLTQPGWDELASWFRSFGFDVDSPEETIPSRNVPGYQASTQGNSPDYALILTPETENQHQSLLDRNTRLKTASLLSKLKPDGEFVVFCRTEKTSDSGVNGHGPDCWMRHLACFHGVLETADVRASWFHHGGWQRLLGRRSDRKESMVSLRIPTERLTLDQWQDHARRGLLVDTPCCDLAKPAIHVRRHAA